MSEPVSGPICWSCGRDLSRRFHGLECRAGEVERAGALPPAEVLNAPVSGGCPACGFAVGHAEGCLVLARIRRESKARTNAYIAEHAPEAMTRAIEQRAAAQRRMKRWTLLWLAVVLLAFALGWLAAETRRGVAETVPDRIPAEVALP